MDQELVAFSVDLLLFLRILAAVSWGALYAAFLQFNSHGQFLVERRTWITVVVGVGVDMLIAYPGTWFTVAGVIVASSIGIIFRSLWNEQARSGQVFNRNKVIWGIEDSTALARDLAAALVNILNEGDLPPEATGRISRALGLAHQIKDKLILARRGEYE